MRKVFAALLVAVPVALIAWVAWSGRGPPRQPLRSGGAPTAQVAQVEVPLPGLFEGLEPEARLRGPVALYDEKTLYDYIDGAAPLYLARHFRRLAAAELLLANGGEATADVYDMGAPENAASIFAAERAAGAREAAGFDAAVAGPMSFVFRRGRFYVKLTAFDARAEAALPAIAQALARRMR